MPRHSSAIQVMAIIIKYSYNKQTKKKIASPVEYLQSTTNYYFTINNKLIQVSRVSRYHRPTFIWVYGMHLNKYPKTAMH